MTYQKENNGKIIEGGTLQFAVSLTLPAEDLIKLKSIIRKDRFPNPAEELKLSPLPVKMAKAFIFDPSGKNIATSPQSSTLTPSYLGGSLPFQMNLNQCDADVIEALINKKNSGIKALFKFSFEGNLPSASFKIKFNYHQTWHLLSKNDELRLQLESYFSGAKIALNKTSIRENLFKNQCISVVAINDTTVNTDIVDRYMDKILEVIGEEMFKPIDSNNSLTFSEEPHEKNRDFGNIFAAKTSVVNFCQAKQSVGYIDFCTSVKVEKEATAGTFIGINHYPESLKKSLVQQMPQSNWPNAYLFLPEISQSPESDITNVFIEASIIDEFNQPISEINESANWNFHQPDSWLSKDGKEIFSLAFPLMSLHQKFNLNSKEAAGKFRLKVCTQIQQQFDKLYEFETCRTTPLFYGDQPLAGPLEFVENIFFDLSLLDFSKEGLNRVLIQVSNGDLVLTKSIKRAKNQRKTVNFVLPSCSDKDHSAKLTAIILFDQAMPRKSIEWLNNGKDLKSISPALFFTLNDSDWQNYSE
ncbi:MAG: hypothetical protein AB1403_02035 [Candidatus Riflebacteria bacterium]